MLKALKEILKKVKWQVLYYGDYNIGHKERQYWFKKVIKDLNLSIGKILDAGCGLGDYSIIYSQYFPNQTVLGIDLAESNIERCNEKIRSLDLKNLNFEIGDILDLSKKNEFKLIFSIDVLEHITDDEKILKNFYSALKKNGYLYVHVPIHVKKYYFDRFRHKFATHDHVIDGYYIEVIKEKINRAGFNIMEVIYTHREIARFAYEIYELFRIDRKCRLILRPLLDFIILIDHFTPYRKTIPAGLGILSIKA